MPPLEMLCADPRCRTGGTGYIGGSVLAALAKEQRKYDITVLLRNPPADFSTQYPSVKVVRGDFDSFDIISNAAAGADIAIREAGPGPSTRSSGAKLTQP
jgi:uncharacterized protein YbjT (DUF2867 family)